MKKLFAVLTLSFIVSATAFAGQWRTQSFINGQWLGLAKNTTYNYGNTNVFFIDNGWQGRWSLSTSNRVPTTGIYGTNYVARYATPSRFWTNAAVFYSTNALKGGFINSTNAGNIIYNARAWSDVQVVPDLNGDLQQNAVISVYIPATNSPDYSWQAFGSATGVDAVTNAMTLTFVKVPAPDQPVGAGSDSNQQKQFVFGQPPQFVVGGGTVNVDYMTLVVTNYGTGTYVYTNVPKEFLQGSRGVRLQSIVTSDDGSTGLANWIKAIQFTDWVP